MNKQIEKLSKRYGIYIPYFLINQKKVLVISMAITKIHPIKSTLNLEVDYITKSEKTYESAFKKIYKHHTHKIHKCKKKEHLILEYSLLAIIC